LKFATRKKTARGAPQKAPKISERATPKTKDTIRKTVARKKAPPPTPFWLEAVRAAESKKATAIRVLDLKPVTSFADYFVLCNGANQRQIQAIADEIVRVLRDKGERPNSIEGYENAEWVLVDYGDMVVHVFSEQSRTYYDLDRLWRDAPEVTVPSPESR
jgi:ribosome-associated protein